MIRGNANARGTESKNRTPFLTEEYEASEILLRNAIVPPVAILCGHNAVNKDREKQSSTAAANQ